MKKKKAVWGRSGQDAAFDGNEDLLAFMYRTYADNLYVYGLSFHSDIGMIEDAIHDVFIDVYINEKRLANISSLQQYIKTAFRHRLLFLLQGNKRYVEIVNDVSDLSTEKNSQELWIENEEENDKKRLVKRLLSGLTRHQREALHLRFIEGLSYDEISEIMQINYQSVKMLIHRAVSRLRNKDISSSPNTD
ncbi:sigma-70 family RNA polymerase sigma factor [uncultured Proteiniphilum sp.]|uniref:RNA polymerase sigma factor n=1 Tax=uncultured Proteiniphilum sp. TaxID=497637 RepID=UPI00261ADDBB|nr:sigma-70 family RNA polymerase sigma factor [uncultured Proteiniphilum sp.]